MARRLLAAILLGILAVGAGLLAFGPPRLSDAPDLIWGQHGGTRDGYFSKPRAAAIDPQDRLFIVDFTARIQTFDLDGHHLGATWTTPDFRNGRPSGLGIDNQGRLIVCDSHYHQVRIYEITGTEVREVKTLGGEAGTKPGQWGYVSDCVQDQEGNYYVSEFGLNDRITKLDPQGRFLTCWGEPGQGSGQFNRVRALALSPDEKFLFAADACNHRIQVFTTSGEFVRQFGEPGDSLGQLRYPYDLAFGPGGDLYVVEYGNHRVQKFTPDGQPLGTWGTPGKGPGQLASPWAVAVDRRGRVFVIDSENHRVQRVRF